MSETHQSELDRILIDFADKYRESRPILQWRLPPRPEDYAAAHEEERTEELDAMCETDK